MRRHIVAVAVAMTCSSAFGQPMAVMTLARARELLVPGGGEQAIGAVPLRGYSNHWDVALSAGLQELVIANNGDGGIAVFDRNGALVASVATNEPVSVQLVDFDYDDVLELVTEEIEGQGTGVFHKAFHLYRIDKGRVMKAWTGESYWAANREPTRLGFLRFDHADAHMGAGLIMTYLKTVEGGPSQTQQFQLVDGQIMAAKKHK